MNDRREGFGNSSISLILFFIIRQLESLRKHNQVFGFSFSFGIHFVVWHLLDSSDAFSFLSRRLSTNACFIVIFLLFFFVFYFLSLLNIDVSDILFGNTTIVFFYLRMRCLFDDGSRGEHGTLSSNSKLITLMKKKFYRCVTATAAAVARPTVRLPSSFYWQGKNEEQEKEEEEEETRRKKSRETSAPTNVCERTRERERKRG